MKLLLKLLKTVKINYFNVDLTTKIQILKPKISWPSKVVGEGLYSFLAMRDILDIKSMQNSFQLILKADFDVRFVFSVVENPGVLSGVETISEIEIST